MIAGFMKITIYRSIFDAIFAFKIKLFFKDLNISYKARNIKALIICFILRLLKASIY